MTNTRSVVVLGGLWLVLLVFAGCGGGPDGNDKNKNKSLEPLTVTAKTLNGTEGLAPFSVIFTATVDAVNAVTKYEWDFENDGLYDYESAISPQAIRVYTVPGKYVARIRVTDEFANEAFGEIEITVAESLIATPSATPLQGKIPLTVTFSPGGKSSGPSIDKYRFDFTGDGTFDPIGDFGETFLLKPDPVNHTYTMAGTYDVVAEVEDEFGKKAQATLEITASPAVPVVQVSVAPSNGAVPLDIVITVTASSLNGPITEVEIDPDDNTPLITLPGSGVVNHTFTKKGQYEMTVKVTDSADQTVTVQSPLVDVLVGGPGAPTAVATASPTTGQAPLDVMFDGSASFDPDGTIVSYEWDFDYDGGAFDVDASSTSPTTTHVYDTAGLRIAALRVKDDASNSSIDAVGVAVLADVQLNVPDDTINPHVGEVADVKTTLSAGLQNKVEVKSRGGVPVRTLFEGFRDPGMYVDTWDGRDEAGIIVLDADYYAEIEYLVDGEDFKKPDTPSGGIFGFVSKTQNVANGGTIDPWNDQFWEMTFDTNLANTTDGKLMSASEVTLWITPFSNGTVITDTVLQSDVFGTGIYQSYWEGVTDSGKYLSAADNAQASGGDYLWSAQGFRLPDNVIVVEGGRPLISNPMAEPNIADPSTRFCGLGDGVDVSFELDRDAMVDTFVYHMPSGNLLRVMSTEPLGAGPHTINWDGKAITGEWAAEGPYRIDLRARALDGNESYRRRVLTLVNF